MAHECIILADAPDSLIELCGISILERLLRSLQRCGIARATVLTSTPDLVGKHLAKPSWPRKNLEVTVRERPDGRAATKTIVNFWPDGTKLLLLVRGDHVFDDRLLRAFATRNSAAILVDSEWPAKLCGLAVIQRDWAEAQNGSLEETLGLALEQRSLAVVDVADLPAYSPSLRRELRPFWFSAPTSREKKEAKRVLLNSIQKGTQDFPAYVHAPFERFLVSHLARTSITPNQLTAVWAFAALITTVLFGTGQLISGIIIALIVGLIDGLDGKLARLKVETTKGGKLEHRLDTLFEVGWPTALAYHFYVSGQLPGAFYYLFGFVAAAALGGIFKGIIYFTAEKLMEPTNLFDQLVRLVGWRRNTFVWIMAAGLILRAPAHAFVVAVWWQFATTIADLPQATWALWRLRRKKSS